MVTRFIFFVCWLISSPLNLIANPLNSINADLNNLNLDLEDKTTGVLSGNLSIDNRIFSQEGRKDILESILSLPTNIVKTLNGVSTTFIFNPLTTAYEVLTNQEIKLSDSATQYLVNQKAMVGVNQLDRSIINELSVGIDLTDISQALRNSDIPVSVYYNPNDGVKGFYDNQNKVIYLNGAYDSATNTTEFVKTFSHERAHFLTHNENMAKNAGSYGRFAYGVANFLSLTHSNTKGRKYDLENSKAYYKPISPTEWYENQSKNIGFGDIKRRGGSKNNSKNSVLDLSSNNKGLDLKNTNLDFDLGNGKNTNNGNSGKNQNNANLDLKAGTAKNANNTDSNNTKLGLKDSTKNTNNQNNSKNTNSNNANLDSNKSNSKNTNSNKSNQTKNFKDILDYNTYQASLVEDRDNAKIMKRPLDNPYTKNLYGKDGLEIIASLDPRAKEFYEKNKDKLSKESTLKVQHEQIFFEDEQGGNIGFSTNSPLIVYGKGIFIIEPEGAIDFYQETDGKHYDDATMRKAVRNVKPYFKNSNYSVWSNNCQKFTHSVIAEYYRIMREETPSLKGYFK